MNDKKVAGRPDPLGASARTALDARRRIERAIEKGHVPAWVMDACDIWERAAMAYGATLARQERAGLDAGNSTDTDAAPEWLAECEATDCTVH